MPGFLAGELWKPENRYLHAILKTATAVGVPPSLLMEPGKTEPVWTERDKKLLVAWQTYQDELCKNCGTPVWLGHSEDPTIQFEDDTTVCYGCQHLQQKNKEDKELPDGATRYVKPVPATEEDELPTRAAGYKTVQ